MSTPVIETRELRKAFGSKLVLDGINLRVEKSESLVIIGGSGSGKSVLLKCILGLLQPDSGDVLIDGVSTANLSTDEREKLMEKFGMLFQGGALFDSLSVWENITFALARKGLTKEQRVALAQEKLTAVGLKAETAFLKPSELSGGMQKRVSLARAICADPPIVFFDEPTTGLDPIMADVINDLIVACTRAQGKTTLTITHDMASAHKIGTRIAMIYQGKIIYDGAADTIMQSGNDYVDQFVHGRAHGPI
ncbi:MAG: ATP-binding cassette domain-containing protein [Rickettsiales bacterium]|nr:ATP-binding cassette domain-containing protein [Rickettsiales bacterium]